MVGILMNASVQITNKKRVRRVTKKNDNTKYSGKY